MKSRYLIRPKADQNILDQAVYLATEGGSHIGHEFLVALHHIFNLLARQPRIGWRFALSSADIGPVRAFTVSGFRRFIILYRVSDDVIEILRVVHGSRNLSGLLSREGIE